MAIFVSNIYLPSKKYNELKGDFGVIIVKLKSNNFHLDW